MQLFTKTLNKMKITKQITSQVEVEVSLPIFRKKTSELLDKQEYFAFYGEKHTDNINFSIEKGQVGHLFNFAWISDVEQGEEITFDEFSEAFTRFNEMWHLLYSQVSDKAKQGNGEYYQENLNAETNLDKLRSEFGSTANEETDDLGFQEFKNTTL